MKKLPPIVCGIEGNSLLLQEIKNVDFEFLGYLLSCHLVIEHYLDEFILTLGTSLKWDNARLNYSQKVALFPEEIFPHGVELIRGVKHLNSLRNKVAHNIRMKSDEIKVQPLIDYLKLVYSDEKDVPSDPLAVLEQFTSLACSGFIGWVACDAQYGGGRAKK